MGTDEGGIVSDMNAEPKLVTGIVMLASCIVEGLFA
jgi:hypothetical protein